MNENELYVVKEYKFDNPLIHKIESIIGGRYRDCHNTYFHTFKYVCMYDINLVNIIKNEIFNISISDESMNLFELNKKLTLARQRGFKFLHIKKLTIKISSNLSHKTTHYYLKLQIPMGHRQFFRKISKNRDFIKTFCNDCGNPFHFACRQWYSYNVPGILT